jgi:hypothetical protein
MMVITMLVIVIEVVVRNHRAPGSIPARGPSVALSTIVMHRCPYRCIGIIDRYWLIGTKIEISVI